MRLPPYLSHPKEGGAVELTAEQLRAVEAPETRVFVAAGAGTGKTSLLVARYLRGLLHHGLGVDDLPTVTFTRKAAAEMNSRIRAALLDEDRPDLAWSLDGAPIGTIHGLCASLLRAHPLQAGVDPSFVVADDEQASILRAESLDGAWERLVLEADEDRLDRLARHQKSVRAHALGLYLGLRGLGHERPRFVVPSPGALDAARRRLIGAGDVVIAETAGLSLKSTAAGNLEKVQACLEWLPGAYATWEDLDHLGTFVPHLNCGAVRPVFEEWKSSLAEFRIALGGHYLWPLAIAVDRLLIYIGEEYTRRKTELSLLDFADVEIRALKLLRSGVRPFSTGARLMVDEFQDTNELQCDLIEKLGVPAVLTVGDLYQSIYGFRGADVEVFCTQEEAVGARDTKEASCSRLSLNFRSRKAVLDVVNRIFAHEGLFGGAFPPLIASRTDDAPRVGSSDARGALSPAVEVVVLDRGGPADASTAWQQTEARAVADLVADLIGPQGWRPRDVVILLRAFTYVHELEEALVARGLPAYVIQGRGFYDHEEFGDLLALLRSLVNPHDDISLVTVLRSPLGAVSDDVLYLLRLQADRLGGTTLWEAMRERVVEGAAGEDAERLTAFEQRLEGLRRQVGAPGLSRLIDAAVTQFDYDLALLKTPGGSRRFANIRKLMLVADEFEALEGPDLAGFVRYIRRRRDLAASREGNAPLLAEEDDVVRVMTVHQAKGLEFPVVVVAGMGTGVRAGHPMFPLDRSDRVSLRMGDPQATRFGGPLILGPADDVALSMRMAELEEEKRLYYVAMTRAMERLVLVGSLKSSQSGEAERPPLTLVLDALGVAAEQVVAKSDDRPVAGLDVVVRRPVVFSASLSGPRFEALEPVAPPAAAPALPHARRMGVSRVSFSSLADYARCPRGYYLERVLGLSRWRERGASAAVPHGGLFADPLSESTVDWASAEIGAGLEPEGRLLGTLVHAVLERVALGPLPGVERVRKALRDAAQARGYEQPDTDLVERGVALVRAFWRSPYAAVRQAQSAVDSTLSAVATEVPFVFSRGETLVSGVIDLLDRRPDGWLAIDYKTNRLGGRRPEEAASAYRLQGELYALACLLGGAAAATVAFVFLGAPESPVGTTYLPADRSALERRLDEALVGLAEGSFPANPAGCSGCRFRALCMV